MNVTTMFRTIRDKPHPPIKNNEYHYYVLVINQTVIQLSEFNFAHGQPTCKAQSDQPFLVVAKLVIMCALFLLQVVSELLTVR
jgi:hypothetical protein